MRIDEEVRINDDHRGPFRDPSAQRGSVSDIEAGR
jgi:hypothetical protein